MSKIKNILFGTAAFLLIAVLFCVKLTGGLLHVLLGAVLVILISIHVWKKRERKKYVPGSWRTVNNLLLITMSVMIISGILMHPSADFLPVKILHKLSAAVFCIGCIAHALQHRKMRKG